MLANDVHCWADTKTLQAHELRRIFDEMGKISLVDVVLPTRNGPEIRRRCVRRPTDHQAILLDRLSLTLPRQVKS